MLPVYSYVSVVTYFFVRTVSHGIRVAVQMIQIVVPLKTSGFFFLNNRVRRIDSRFCCRYLRIRWWKGRNFCNTDIHSAGNTNRASTNRTTAKRDQSSKPRNGFRRNIACTYELATINSPILTRLVLSVGGRITL